MITNLIIQAIFFFIALITSPLLLFPDVALDARAAANITLAHSYLLAADSFLPITPLLTIFGVVLAIELAIFSYKVAMWIKQLVW